MAAPPPPTAKARPKGPYNCGICGQPKRGHTCTGRPSIAADAPAPEPPPAAPAPLPSTEPQSPGHEAMQTEPIQTQPAPAETPSAMVVDPALSQLDGLATPAPDDAATPGPSSGTPAPPSTAKRRGRPPKKNKGWLGKRDREQAAAAAGTDDAGDATPAPAASATPTATPPSSGKKVYNCGICGLPKRGHTCITNLPALEPAVAVPPTATPDAPLSAYGRPQRRRVRTLLVESDPDDEEEEEEEEEDEEGKATGDAAESRESSSEREDGNATAEAEASAPKRTPRARKNPAPAAAVAPVGESAAEGAASGDGATDTPKKVYLCSRCQQPKRGHVCTEAGDPAPSVASHSDNDAAAAASDDDSSAGSGRTASARKRRRRPAKRGSAPASPRARTFRAQVGDLLSMPVARLAHRLPRCDFGPRPAPPAALPLYARWLPAALPPAAQPAEFYPTARLSPPLSVDGAAAESVPLFAPIKCARGAAMWVGGPAWAVEWLESGELDAHTQYLAIAPIQEMAETHRLGRRYEGKNMVQIWQVSLGAAAPHMVCGIAHNGAFVVDMRWCPHSAAPAAPPAAARLGLLAACLGDGRLVVWSVPRVAPAAPPAAAAPVYALAPVFDLVAPPAATFACVRWAPASAECAVLLTGRTDGAVQVWSVRHAHDAAKPTLASPVFDSRCHEGAVRALSFSPSASLADLRFVSVGMDGCVHAWDAQQTFRPLSTLQESVALVDVAWPAEGVCFAAPEEPAISAVNLASVADSTVLPAHTAALTRLDAAPAIGCLATAGRDGAALVHTAKRTLRGLKVSLREGVYAIRTKVKITAKSEETQTKANARASFPDPAIAITAVRWNPNAAGRGWLAIGTAVGVVYLLPCDLDALMAAKT